MAKKAQNKRQRLKPDTAFRWRAMLGLSLIAFLGFGIVGWASTSSLSGAVIAAGQIVVDSSVKKIQHPTGGVIEAINVKAGDRVAAGDLLVHLDDTQTRASLEIVRTELTELFGRKSRLAAERDGATEISFPTNFERSHPEAVRIMTGEQRLFAARLQSKAEQKGQLKERIGQFQSEIIGLTKQDEAKTEELHLVRDELGRVMDLYKRNLLPITRLLQIQRDAARIEGEHGSLLSEIARAKGQVSETELRIIELESTRQADAQKELREIEERVGELTQREVAARDTLQRVDIKAPISGTVNELAIHTIGGVIAPGETIMSIVPMEDEKVIEVRLAPTDIDQVSVGQKAILRFLAFNQRTTPELKGTVSVLASDVMKDTQTGASYYTARLHVDEADQAKFTAMKLVAGMPVEGFIETTERTALSYLVKPFSDQLARAFREE